MSQPILVTGSAGFIGHALTKALLSREEAVVGIDNLNDYYDPALKQARLDDIDSVKKGTFAFHQVDLADHAALNNILAAYEFRQIVHLGAQAGVRYSIENPRAYVHSNLSGHVNILEAAREQKVAHMVYASSSSVYGLADRLPLAESNRVDHPISLYAATKKADELMSETYAHLYGVPMTGLRFFTVYGPWGRPDMAYWKFTKAILNGEPIEVYNNGDMRRDFTYIDDIVGGIIAALDNPPKQDGQEKPGGSTNAHAIYNIGNNRPEELGDMIAVIEKSCGIEAQKNYLPMQAGDVYETYADITAITRDLGYRPTTSIETGLPAFVEWYRQYHGV